MAPLDENRPAALPGLTAEDEAALRDAMKRCSPATVETALAYRRSGDPALVPAIVIGVIERYVEPDLRARLREADDETRLIEDLGIDSLTIMEIVMLVEEILKISINNDELRHLRSLGDLKVFMDCKVRGLPLPKPPKFFPIEQIAAIMPMQPPFLFLHEATVSGNQATGRYRVGGEEFFLQGHFKDNPIVPASIMLEALGQLAVLQLLVGFEPEAGKRVDPTKILFTGTDGVRCHRICRPGDTLALTVKLKRAKAPLAAFEGHIRVGQERASVVEEIMLTFGVMEQENVVPEAAPAASATSTDGSSTAAPTSSSGQPGAVPLPPIAAFAAPA